jgi:hypothetical protein
MVNRNSENPDARSGHAVTADRAPADREPGGHPSEPKSYVAKDKRDATLAPPAAGEMTDYADEGHASGGAQQGGNKTNRGQRDPHDHHGPTTTARNKDIIEGGLPPER